MLPKREAQRHKDAFEFYYSMPKRSFTILAQKYHVSKTTISHWSRAFGWAERIAKRDEKAKQKTEEAVTDAIANFNKRRIMLAHAIQAKAAEALAAKEKGGKSFKTLSEAVSSIKVADEIEAKALGIPDERIEHSGNVLVEFEIVKGNDSTKSKTD